MQTCFEQMTSKITQLDSTMFYHKYMIGLTVMDMKNGQDLASYGCNMILWLRKY